jgi:spore coat protein U-like protein
VGDEQAIEVSLTGAFTLKTAASATYQLPYTVAVGANKTAIHSGDVVATFNTTTQEQSKTVYFAAEAPAYAGAYSDTVTFTIYYVDED